MQGPAAQVADVAARRREIRAVQWVATDGHAGVDGHLRCGSRVRRDDTGVRNHLHSGVDDQDTSVNDDVARIDRPHRRR